MTHSQSICINAVEQIEIAFDALHTADDGFGISTILWVLPNWLNRINEATNKAAGWDWDKEYFEWADMTLNRAQLCLANAQIQSAGDYFIWPDRLV